MCNSRVSSSGTMSLVAVVVLVCVVSVCGDMNSTALGRGSKMAWTKELLDHHDWLPLMRNGSQGLKPQCAADMLTYLAALNDGQVWASKSEYFLNLLHYSIVSSHIIHLLQKLTFIQIWVIEGPL